MTQKGTLQNRAIIGILCLCAARHRRSYAKKQRRNEDSMKKDAKTMKEVAERCTKYCRCDNCNCSNSSMDEAISCRNCMHYTPEKVCDIDLYAEIVDNHDL